MIINVDPHSCKTFCTSPRHQSLDMDTPMPFFFGEKQINKKYVKPYPRYNNNSIIPNILQTFIVFDNFEPKI